MIKNITDLPVEFEEIDKNDKNNNKMSEKKEMTIEEMEAKIARMKEKERKAREKEQLAYVTNRDENIESIIQEALQLNELVKAFKDKVAHVMELQAEKLTEYGKIRKNSKGGFSITNTQGAKRVVRRRDTEPTWDERGDKGVLMLKDFLGDVVKKRDIKMYEILMSFLERNQNGDLEYSRVMDLLKHEGKWNDERWVEGLHLVKESYSNVMKGYGYQFVHRPKEGDKWQNINLSFSSI